MAIQRKRLLAESSIVFLELFNDFHHELYFLISYSCNMATAD